MPRYSPCGPSTRRTRNSDPALVAPADRRVADEQARIVGSAEVARIVTIGHIEGRHRPADGIVHPDTVGADQGEVVDLRQTIAPATQEVMNFLRTQDRRNSSGVVTPKAATRS